MFPLADARGRVLGFQARKLRDDDPLAGKYVNSPEGDLFQKGSLLYGLDRARAAIARGGSGGRRRGKRRRHRAAAGGARAGRRLDGDRIDRPPAPGAQAADRPRHPVLRRRRGRRGGDAPRDGSRRRPGPGGQGRSAAGGLDPADTADSFAGLLTGAKSYPVYRVDLEVRRLLPDKQAAWLRTREILERFRDSPDRQDAVRVAADLLGLPPELQAGLAPAATLRTGTGTVSAKALDADLRREQDALAGVIANPGLVPSLAELTPEHFDLELHRRVREHLGRGRPPTTRSSASSRSSTPGPPARRSTSRRPKNSSSACASARCAASWRGPPTRPGSPSCRPRSRSSASGSPA